jgi:hypothetical protein
LCPNSGFMSEFRSCVQIPDLSQNSGFESELRADFRLIPADLSPNSIFGFYYKKVKRFPFSVIQIMILPKQAEPT